MITRQLRDGWNFVRKMTARRWANAIKLISGYYLANWTKKPVQFGYPISISIEPTTSCNLRCPECPSGLRSFSRNTGMLSLERFQRVVDQVYHKTPYLTLYFQGEPYLNKAYYDMVSYAAHERNMYVATSTNAHYLTEEAARKTVESGLSRMIISIDGTTQDTYVSYRRGGNLEKVIEGAKNMVKAKKEAGSSTPHIIFQFLVVAPNEHQIPEILQLGKDLDIDEVKLKTAQVYNYKNGNPLIPENEKYSRYKKQKDGTYKLKNKLSNHCWKLWHSCVFTWDGNVLPCCFDKDGTHVMGNIDNASFEQIWHNNQYLSFRNAILKGRDQIDICKNCTEGCKIWT